MKNVPYESFLFLAFLTTQYLERGAKLSALKIAALLDSNLDRIWVIPLKNVLPCIPPPFVLKPVLLLAAEGALRLDLDRLLACVCEARTSVYNFLVVPRYLIKNVVCLTRIDNRST